MSSTSKVCHIASQILRASGDISCEARLTIPNFGHAEPHVAERELAKFIQERGYKELSPRDAAALIFRVACAVLKTEKFEDGFEIEIDDDAVLPFASERTRKIAGAA